MLSSSLCMDSSVSKDASLSSSSSEDPDVASECFGYRTFPEPPTRRAPTGRAPGRSRSFDRRGAAGLADLMKSAMVVSAESSPESLMKRGGNGTSRDIERASSPSPRKVKRCRSVTEDLIFEDEDNDLAIMSREFAALKAREASKLGQR